VVAEVIDQRAALADNAVRRRDVEPGSAGVGYAVRSRMAATVDMPLRLCF
jgi:hypothetical protein